MSNKWTINEDISKDFDTYAAAFKSAQPPYAKKACLSLSEIAPWTNRVPEHEPWPRVMKQDKGNNPQNEENDGYKNNVDWIDQYDNETSREGLEFIGKVEGDETIDRGPLWRR